MNAPFGGALDSSPSHPPEVYAARKKIIKDGRHVGLDFYDLLIEALIEVLSAVASFASLDHSPESSSGRVLREQLSKRTNRLHLVLV